MALSFGQKIARTSSAISPSFTSANITIANNEKLLVVLLKGQSANVRTGGALTFGSQTMTQANSTQKAALSPEASAELWYLFDPTPGTNQVTIPNAGAITIFYTLVTAKTSTLTNRTGLIQLDGANGGNNTSTNPTPGAVTTKSENAIGFAITAGGWTTWAPSAQIGTILANTDDGADGGGEQYLITSSPGSYTLSWTFATSDDWGAVVAFFSEITPPIMNNYQFVKAGDGISVGERIR